ncbi:MAG: ABC transporter ATP-binding protein [Methanothrix sp.]|nr:ABC transporter ATP-binding protein [Methanothrix sp.]
MKGKSVQASGICKRYKSFFGRSSTILDNISLDIDAGDIFGLLGPNGSGKTTLISIFSTLIYPEAGSSRTVRDQIDAFELGEFQDHRFEDLSTGLKQRLSLAKAMLNHPSLIFLDEPTTGLDPDISIKTRQLIRRIHEEEGISVVLSTHYMPEAEMLCDKIAFLRQGRIVALDTPHNLKRHLALGERIAVSYQGEADLGALEEQPGILGLKAEKGRVEIIVDRSEESLDGIIKLFAKAKITDIAIKEPDLEDVFIELAR